jgi:HAMP domain-containing protein
VTDVGYVAAGWLLTGAVLLAYWLRVQQRIRRAERLERDS